MTQPQPTLLDTIILISISLFSITSLTLLHTGLYPTVFADEWLYSSSARLLPLSASVTPSYLYLLIFKSTTYCGSEFLSCARFLNAVFFTCSLPFIYMISRSVCNRNISFLIAILALLGPINTYTAYFMPESLYYFSFWLFAWFVLTNIKKSPAILAAGAGMILATMSLIKMNALFLVPCLIIFLIKSRNAIISIIILLTVFFSCRLVAGFLLAGMAGISLTGVKYSTNAHAIFNLQLILQTLSLIKIPMLGHLAAMAMLFGIPLAVLGNETKKNDLMLFTLSCLIPLLFVTIFTSAQIVGWDLYEDINRLHMRFYNFLFPLFFIIAGSEISSREKNTFSIRTLLMVILICCAVIYGMIALPNHYLISYIDCPELRGFSYQAILFKLFNLTGIILLLLWMVNKKWGATLYTCFFLPAVLLTASYFVNTEHRNQRLITDVYDRAGQFAHFYLGAEATKLVVIGPELAGLYKSLFYIDDAKATTSLLSLNTPIEFAKIPADKSWVLYIGEYPVLRKPLFKISMGEYTLIKIQ